MLGVLLHRMSALAGGAAAEAAGQAAAGDGRDGGRRQLHVPGHLARPVGHAALPQQRPPQGCVLDAVRSLTTLPCHTLPYLEHKGPSRTTCGPRRASTAASAAGPCAGCGGVPIVPCPAVPYPIGTHHPARPVGHYALPQQRPPQGCVLDAVGSLLCPALPYPTLLENAHRQPLISGAPALPAD